MGVRTVSSDEDEEFEEREDLMDNQAAEDGDGDRDEDGEEGGGGDEEEEDEDEEEEGQDEYENDGFIVDDVDEEEEDVEEEAKESSDEDMKRRKKKRKKPRVELDDDDYELLQEANVPGFHRPSSQGSKTKFKRLKKAGGVGGQDSRGAQRGFSDDEEFEEGGRRGRTAEEELKRSLFGDDEGAPPEDLGEEEEPEEEIGDDDEMADFIVDEEEVDENGERVRRRQKKKKGPRRAVGISSVALQEAHEIFGDVEDLLNRRKYGLRGERGDADNEMDDDDGYRMGRTSAKKLEEEFEPSILEEKYMTSKDDRIREYDMPERLQLLEETIGPSSKEPKTKEAEWIYDRAFGLLAVPLNMEFQHLMKLDKATVVQQIAFVLTQLHDNKLEIPFIGMYRKEGCIDLVDESHLDIGDSSNEDKKCKLKRYKVLWAVQFWDQKWRLLQRRKRVLEGTFEKRVRVEDSEDLSKATMLEKLLGMLREAQSEQAVDDVDAIFNIRFPPDDVEVEHGQFKRPKRRSFYSICRKAGLESMAKEFGLTSEKFGENLQAMYKMHEVADPSSAPEDVAMEHSFGEMKDAQAVLKGARHMAAVEISCEPAVREYVRNIYMDKAVISTKPTAQGNSTIDAFHQYACVKWLSNKPVNVFNDGQWLLIQKAEEEKLLEVTIGLPKEFIDETLMSEFETQYLSDGVSRTVQLWNEQRKLILKDALLNFLLPQMEKEARLVLTSRAKNWVAMDCGAQLWNRVSIAPHPHPKSDSDERMEEEGAPRVMACVWGPGKPPTTFVMLDTAGEIINTLQTGYLSMRTHNAEQEERKKFDQQRLLKFMMEYQPHVVVLGANNLQCRSLKDAIFEAIFKIVEHHPRDLAEGLDMIQVVYGDESIPSLYEHSRISIEQLPGQQDYVRRAVALGRYLQNPLAVVGSLCSSSREILSLKLHKMQDFLSPDDLYGAIEEVMVTVTNQVGVDINLAASHDWLFAPLQFVSGLGPRKASMIQRSIQGAGRITSRKEMLTSLRLMKKNVFINACGFLRVRGTGQAASSNQILDPLDDTRIHPESYEMAKKMAEDAYCEDQSQSREDMDEEMLEMAIEHVKENPNLIKNVDIVNYANVVQETTGMYKLETLKDIQMELLYGYQDWRQPYTQPTQDEEFFLLTGEDDETLAEGRVINVTVRKVQENRVTCGLDSGLFGVIQKEHISDEKDFEIADKVTPGSIIACRVKGFQKAKYLVELTCKGSELRSDHWLNFRSNDPYYKLDESLLKTEQERMRKEKEEKQQKSFKPRMIVHPQFQNLSMADAVQALADKDVGELIIRPSSKGPTHLSITLKIFDGVCAHLDIVEGGKDSKDFTSFLRLGKTLTIGDETFEDLDEVIARYVDPLVGNLKVLLAYRKFRAGSKAQVDEHLKKEKAANPMRIVYCLSVSHEHPGAFLLSYLKNVTVHHEYLSLSPKGFKFRKRVFDSLDKLVFYFQKHVNDPIIEPQRAVAAMVPMKSPAPASFGGVMDKHSDQPPYQAFNGANAGAPETENGYYGRGGRGFRGSGRGGRGGRDYGRGGGRDWGGRGGRQGWNNDGPGRPMESLAGNNWSGGGDGWGKSMQPDVSKNDGWGSVDPVASNGGDGWGKPSLGDDGWGGGKPSAGKPSLMEGGWGGGKPSTRKPSTEDGWGGGGKPFEKPSSTEDGWGGGGKPSMTKPLSEDGWGRKPFEKPSMEDGWGKSSEKPSEKPLEKASAEDGGWAKPSGDDGWGNPNDGPGWGAP